MLFGQERADRALSLLDREARFANTNNDVTGSSFTAARSAAQKELFPSDASSFGVRRPLPQVAYAVQHGIWERGGLIDWLACLLTAA